MVWNMGKKEVDASLDLLLAELFGEYRESEHKSRIMSPVHEMKCYISRLLIPVDMM